MDMEEQSGDLSDAQLYHMAPSGCYVLRSAKEDGRPELAPVIGRGRFLPSGRRFGGDITYGLVRPRLDETFGVLNLTEPT
jgi:hypothetical protein